ncbi:MAG: hypothetical protein ABGY71_15905, partial [bacterium]
MQNHRLNTFALPLALLLGAILSGCSLSGPAAPTVPSTPPGELALEGQWVFQLEGPSEEGAIHSSYREFFVNFSETSSGTQMFLDLDGDLAFAEATALAVSGSESRLAVGGSYEYAGISTTVNADLDDVIWGYVAGTWTEEVNGVTTEYHAVAVRVANPPQFDIQGLWSMSLFVEWTSAELSWLTGSQSNPLWNIVQVSSGPTRGLLRVTDELGRHFIGVVNDSQVTLARRHDDDLGLVTYTFPTLNPQGGYISGQLQATLVNAQGEHKLGWALEGQRASAVTAPGAEAGWAFDENTRSWILA